MLRGLGVFSLLALLAGVASAGEVAGGPEQLRIDEFSRTRICACDCVYLYELTVDLDRYRPLNCTALDMDGDRAEISRDTHTPPDRLIFFSPAEITDFRCEGTRLR